uniref:Putative secreted salivary protease inhibitor n=1 Tax=Ixodes scapularis TaxID=6945 RepID=A0A4D5RQ97_IXOSC
MKVLVFTVVVMILVAASEGRRWSGMPGPGPCKAAFPRYKCVKGRCLEYIYGGCGRDGGGYLSMAECERRCKGLKFPFPRPPTERRHERTLVAN